MEFGPPMDKSLLSLYHPLDLRVCCISLKGAFIVLTHSDFSELTDEREIRAHFYHSLALLHDDYFAGDFTQKCFMLFVLCLFTHTIYQPAVYLLHLTWLRKITLGFISAPTHRLAQDAFKIDDSTIIVLVTNVPILFIV